MDEQKNNGVSDFSLENENPFVSIENSKPQRRYAKKPKKEKKTGTPEYKSIGGKRDRFRSRYAKNPDERTTQKIKKQDKKRASKKTIFRICLGTLLVFAVVFGAFLAGSLLRENPESEPNDSVTIDPNGVFAVIYISGKSITYNGELSSLSDLRKTLRAYDPSTVTVSLVDDNADSQTWIRVQELLESLQILVNKGSQ